MSDPIKHVDRFVDDRSRRPLWVAGWTVFLAAGAFAANTFLELPQQNALIEQDNAVALRYAQMAAKLDFIPKALELVVDANIRAAKFFRSEIESLPLGKPISPETAAEAKRLIAETRGGIDALTSTLDSLQIGDAEADAMVAKFREDLAPMDELIVRREQVVDALQVGDIKHASQMLGLVRSDPDGRITRQMNAFALRTTAFAQMAETKKREHAADLQLRSVRRDDYQKRIWLLGLCAAYMGAFLVVALRAWSRDRSRDKSNNGRNEGKGAATTGGRQG